jgi:Cu(I)/Ag(I) efflux system membrane fusion protein
MLKRNQVFVVRSEGKFEPREVELGLESGGKVIVLSGVEAGETVVTSAQFLIDSESKLREATSKMQDAASHEGHDMQDESEVQK